MLSRRVSNVSGKSSVQNLTKVVNRSNSNLSTLKVQLQRAKIQYENNTKISLKINNLLDLIPKPKSVIDPLTRRSEESNEKGFQPYKVRIGVIESRSIVEKNQPSLLNTLLCDPYDSNQFWYKTIQKERSGSYRDTTLSILSYSPVFLEEYLDANTLHFGIPSPILNRELRVIQKSTDKNSIKSSFGVNRELFNDIEFVEIGEKYKESNSDRSKIRNIEKIELGVGRPRFNEDQCHFYIYVKNDTHERIPDKYKGYPILEVVNSEDRDAGFLSTSEGDRNSNNIKVDILKANEANELLMKSFNNVNKYQELITASNINDLIYIIDKETSGYIPIVKGLKSLFDDISLVDSDKEVALVEIKDKEKSLSKEIEKWSQLSHYELQSRIIPFLDEVLINKFSKINEILLNIDDYDLVVANVLFDNNDINLKSRRLFGFLPGKKISDEDKSHGSLKNSNEELNYLSGKIDSELNTIIGENSNTILSHVNEESKKIVLNKPIKDLRLEIINHKLPAVQHQIHDLVTKNLINVNFPTFAVVSVMNIMSYMDLETSIAFVVLSFAISFNNISKGSVKYLQEFKNWYVDRIRQTIDNCSQLLHKKIEDRTHSTSERINDKYDNIESLRESLSDLERLQRDLEK